MVASNMLNVPRLTMAMAGCTARVLREDSSDVSHALDLDPDLAAISLALALQAGLLQNLSLSAVSRLLLYGGVCASLPVFRSRDARGIVTPGVEPALFRVKGGTILAAIGMGLSVVLVTRMNQREAFSLALTVAVASAHWLY
jgi:hypothetical protein